ncbi:hypothetical protein F2Q69_00035496 [Brassica cretica]|uniref:Uncharacterized protein n=1 Tax=Brassica cretica TaxID=69181 RepID=A0A8S9SA68_BRACR|nr:hypothetical protein F2Q69_00035496 [Brassica cretica]
MSNTPYHGEEISADNYAALTRHQFNLERLGERLQRIENTTATMKDKWRRGDEAMRDFTEEISADNYAALTRHQFNLERLGERLQRIENTTATMKDKWRRGDEAMRDFTGTWFNKRKEEMDTCFPTSHSSQHY